jgi:hypothetical protein
MRKAASTQAISRRKRRKIGGLPMLAVENCDPGTVLFVTPVERIEEADAFITTGSRQYGIRIVGSIIGLQVESRGKS